MLCQNLFFDKVPWGLQLYQKRLAQVFSGEFSEFFKNTFFTEQLRMTASDIRMQVVVIYN